MIENCLVSLSIALVALTVKVNVPVVVGFPEITPTVERVKFVGNDPTASVSMLHVIGVFPVAASV